MRNSLIYLIAFLLVLSSYQKIKGPSGYGNGHGDSVDKNIIFKLWLDEPVENAESRE